MACCVGPSLRLVVRQAPSTTRGSIRGTAILQRSTPTTTSRNGSYSTCGRFVHGKGNHNSRRPFLRQRSPLQLAASPFQSFVGNSLDAKYYSTTGSNTATNWRKRFHPDQDGSSQRCLTTTTANDDDYDDTEHDHDDDDADDSSSKSNRLSSNNKKQEDGLLVVAILGPANAGKSTLFNRFMCRELNRTYRLATEKNTTKQAKKHSKGRIGSSAKSTRSRNGAGAIVTNVPGTTRDRRECYGRIGGTVFRLVDTAGVDAERIGYLAKRRGRDEENLNRQMMQQTLQAARTADLILLLFDARVGVTSDLAETARWLRKVSKQNAQQHVLVLANKLEGDQWQYDDESPVTDHLTEATRVGFGEALPISAEHGEGMSDIAVVIEELSEHKRQALGLTRDDVLEQLQYGEFLLEKAKSKNDNDDDDDDSENTVKENNNNNISIKPKKEKPLQLAILGRPNVGKSTLVNALLGEERVIAGATPGLTRDAIMVEWAWRNRPVQLVDTAGIRKITQRSRDSEIEDRSVQDANRAMKVADVAVLVLDAQAGNLRRQELAIADAVVKEGRALVIVANKMDLIVRSNQEETSSSSSSFTPQEYAKAVADEIEARLPMLRKTPVVPMSSLTGDNVQKLMPVVFKARERWERTLSTGMLNRWLSDVVNAHPPPPVEGQRNVKIKYVIQTKGRPPTFLLFTNVPHLPPHYMRHLARNFQDTFGMFGMEVRFSVKKSAKENPYDKGRDKSRSGSGLGGREARKKRMIHSLQSTGAPPSPRRKRKQK